MTIQEIKELVVVKLEEHSPFTPPTEPLLAGADEVAEVKPIYSYIDANINQAGNEILLTAPIHRLTPIAVKDGRQFTDTWSDDGTGTPLQIAVIKRCYQKDNWGTDYSPVLRLHTLRMNGWNRDIHSVVVPENPLYTLQSSPWTRGTIQKPVVTDNGDELRVYSVPSSDIVTLKWILPFQDNTDYPTEIGELIALNTAKKVYEAYENQAMAQLLNEELKASVSAIQMS